MESEKPHRNGASSTSDFFFCFSSRSSMKISSKSILSPGRSREPTLSLSSSLSRRLRSNGSMKGGGVGGGGGQGQSSPMFPTGNKKKGCSFETAEPSSPKVTCIGQVRVKTKKKHGRKKMRTRSKRRGEVSFRKTEEGGVLQSQENLKHRNQRWVHLPLTICEALRGFGAEFNCFSPCGGRRSSCSWNGERERDKVEKRRRRRRRRRSSSSCGAVFARWLYALEESEEEKKEEVVVVRREEEVRRVERERERVVEVEIEEEKEEWKEEVEELEVEEEDEEARISICIPPKNALLLMRCRSEPFRTSSLANRFWDSPAPKENFQDDDDEEETEEEEEEEVIKKSEVKEENFIQVEEKKEEASAEAEMVEKLVSSENGETPSKEAPPEMTEKEHPIQETEQEEEPHQVEEEIMVNGSSKGLEDAEEEEETQIEEKVEEVEKEAKRVGFSSSISTYATNTMSVQPEQAEEEGEETEQAEEVFAEAEAEAEAALAEKSTEETETEGREEVTVSEVKQIDGQDGEREQINGQDEEMLPDCLLLMMCEPKLSMEVSKETWVCSTDFINYRHAPHLEKKVIQTNGPDHQSKKRTSTEATSSITKPTHHCNRAHPAHGKQHPPPLPRPPKQKQQQQKVQPARSSCSAAVGPSMASMIEQKLTNAGAYEPFVLTRCKSEPVRSASKLGGGGASEACFWKNRKLEPHRGGAGVGVGAAGIGF